MTEMRCGTCRYFKEWPLKNGTTTECTWRGPTPFWVVVTQFSPRVHSDEGRNCEMWTDKDDE